LLLSSLPIGFDREALVCELLGGEDFGEEDFGGEDLGGKDMQTSIASGPSGLS
jgi:hypothetical protein